MKKILVVLAVSLAGAGCTTASTSGGATQAVDAGLEGGAQRETISVADALDKKDRVEIVDAESGKTKLVCRRIEVTGTRLGAKKVCGTPEQWNDLWAESSDNVGETQRKLMTAPPSLQ